MNKKDLISFRAYEPGDENFIYQTWLKGLRYGNDLFNLIPQATYFEIYHRIIEIILEKPTIEIKIACLKEDPEIILGYSVSEGTTLHWVFVKTSWRKIGLMKDLIPNNARTTSHITTVGKAIMLRKYPHIEFNPFLR